MSEVYLYDDRLVIYYNINKNQPELAESDLFLLESDGFDQRGLCSTKIIAGRTPGSTVFVFLNGIALVFRLEEAKRS